MKKPPCIVFSLKYFDANQGQPPQDWESNHLLAALFDRLRYISEFSVVEATSQQVIKIYGTMPEHSLFNHPKHVPQDAKWCSLRLQGKERVIGFLEENIFYIVFLDKDHDFWPTEKKHT